MNMIKLFGKRAAAGVLSVLLLASSLSGAVFAEGSVEAPVPQAAAPAEVSLLDLLVQNGLTVTTKVNGADYVPGAPIGRDSTLAFTLNYTLDNNAKRGLNSSTAVTYALPDTLAFTEVPSTPFGNGTTGVVYGSYSLTGNTLKINYTDAFLQSSDITGFVTLDAKMTQSATGGGEETKFEFAGATVPITITLEDTIVKGSKSYAQNPDGTLTFTITLTADAPAKNVTLTDTLGANFVYRAGTMQVAGPSGPIAIADPTFTQDGTAEPAPTKATIPLGDLQAGTYTITYQVDVAGSAEENYAKRNYAEWKWTGRTEHTDHAEVWVGGFGSHLAKTGSLDKTNNQVKWTVTVNDSQPRADMGGQLLYDTFSANQTAITGTITIYQDTDSSGTPYATVDAATLTKNADGKTVLYTFPADAGKHRYYLHYNTAVTAPAAGASETYKNTVETSGGDTASGTVSWSNGGTVVGGATLNKYKNQDVNYGLGQYDEWINEITLNTTMKPGMKFIDRLASNENTSQSIDGKNQSVQIWSRHIEGTLVVTYVPQNGTKQTLVEGVDYSAPVYKKQVSGDPYYGGKENPYGNDQLAFTFLKEMGPGKVYVTYHTQSQWGELPAQSQVKIKNYGRVEWETTAGKKNAYQDYEEYPYYNPLSKTGTGPVWDAAVNGGKGGYVAEWTITVNALPGWSQYGVVDYKNNTLTVTDELPTGLSYLAGSAAVKAYTGWWQEVGGYITSSEPTLNAEGNRLTWKFEKSGRQWYTITFKTLLDENVLAGQLGATPTNGQKITYTNTAVMDTGSTALKPATGDVEYVHTLLDKTAQQVKEGLVPCAEYTLVVNRPCAKLNSGSALTLEDVIPTNCTLMTSTVKVYQADTKNELNGVKVSYDSNTRKLAIEVPDATWCTVKYRLQFNVDENTTSITVNNNATLNGISQSSDSTEDEFIVTKSNAGATGKFGSFTLRKIDAENLSKTLKGAEFTLYRIDLDTALVGALNPQRVDAQTTGTDGVITFPQGTDPSLQLDTLYYYLETAAPQGYVQDTAPHYFMLPGNAYAASLAKAEALVGAGNVHEYKGEQVQVSNREIYTTAVLEGTKALTGGTLQAGAFQFILYSVDGKGVRTQLQTAVNAAPVGEEPAAFAFQPISYTKAGVYEYVIVEVDTGKTDVVYDSKEYRATVTVTEEKTDGKVTGLTAATAYPDGTPAFRNTQGVTVTIGGTKTLTGKTLEAGWYTFLMKDAAGNELTATNSAPDAAGNGSFSFTTPLLTAPGDYVYTVSERAGSADSITYDKTVYTVTVTVHDDMSATKKVTKQGEDTETALAFLNRYTATTSIEGVKTLSGMALKANTYTMGLYPADAAGNVTAAEPIGTAVADALGHFAFTGSNTGNQLAYSAPGTFYYVVKEIVPADADQVPGMAYDTRAHHVTVVVAEENGALKATVQSPAGGLKVANVYSTAAEISGMKKLSDGSLPQAGAYQFALYRVNDATGEAEATPIAIAANAADGSFAFTNANTGNALTYTTEGVWHYRLREVLPQDSAGNTVAKQGGVTYDNTVFDVTVTVAKNAEGTLSAVVDKTADALTFINVVEVQAEIAGTKTMNGKVPNAGAFAFELKDSTGKLLGTAQNDASGSFAFTNANTGNALTYSAPGQYHYTVTEQNGGAAGVVYDTRSYDITVTVTQDKTTRALTAKVSKTPAQLKFSNKGTVSAVLGGTKTLFGDTLTDDRFSFELYEATDSSGTLKTPAAPLQTVTNKGGSFCFDALTYTAAGDYYYVIQEQNGGTLLADGTYCDGTVYVAKVTVTEQNETLVPAITYYMQGDSTALSAAPAFVNSKITRYSMMRRSSTAIAGRKLLVNGDGAAAPMTAGQFRFELYDGATLIDTAANNEDGTFTFRLGYKAPGTYTYTAKEQNGGQTIDGIAHDSTVHTLTVTVDAAMNATVLVDGADVPLTFTNTTRTHVTVNKTWEDADNAGGERPASVAVSLLADGVDTGNTQTLTAATGWTYTWNDLLTRTDAGEKIVYTIREEAVQYYTSAVSITQETADGITYALVNTYEDAAATFIDPTITKKLNGAVLEEAQFQFGLYDGSDTLLSTATNRADGSVVFPSLTFTRPGTYRYIIREIPGTDVHVLYDTTAIGAIVTVSRDAANGGSLRADVAYLQGGAPTADPTLTNSYSAILLQVQKTSKDDGHAPLQGAVYGLYRVNESGARDVFISSCESDANGLMRFGGIEPGQKYYFKEISAPAGHTVDEYATEIFWVTQDSTTGAISILVQNAEGSWVPSEAYDVSGSMPVAQSAQNSIATMSLAEEEIAAMSLAEEGIAAMSLAPEETPVPYSATVAASAPAGGVVITARGVSDEITKLTVAKLDRNTRAFVAGATLQILQQSSGTVVYQWVTGDGVQAINRALNVNTVYILREVSAPDGYEKAADTEFIFDAYGNLSVRSGADAEWVSDTRLNLYDTPIPLRLVNRIYNNIVKKVTRTVDSPKTGDDAPILPVLIFVLADLVAILYLEHRKYVKNTKR